MTPTVIHWNPHWGPINRDSMRRRLEAEGYAVSEYRYSPGTNFPMHTHAVDKKDTVLQGRLRIGWAGGAAVLEPGDMIEIPSGVQHSAEVVGMDEVISLGAAKIG